MAANGDAHAATDRCRLLMSGPRPVVLIVRPNTADEIARAVRYVRRHAQTDADDLLAALGLT